MYSATGTRTRVARVRAEYPNQLDYSGVVQGRPTGIHAAMQVGRQEGGHLGRQVNSVCMDGT